MVTTYKRMKYLSLLKTKLFWKAVYTYIKYLFIGMDQHKDWGKICRNAKIEAITVFTRPLAEQTLINFYTTGVNELSEMMVEYYSISRGDMIILNGKKKRIIRSVDSVTSFTIWGSFVSRIILFWWWVNISWRSKK